MEPKTKNMIGTKHFIAHIPEKYSKTFKTESGIELHADRRFSLKRVANVVVDISETPLLYKGPIKKGDTVLLDTTVLSFQYYVKGGEQENVNLIDRNKKLYKIADDMILMHRPKNSEWSGYRDNVLLERIPLEPIKKINSLYIPDSAIKTHAQNKGVIAFLNIDLGEQGLNVGDIVHTKGDLFVDVWLDGKQYMWSKNKYLIAVEPKEVV